MKRLIYLFVAILSFCYVSCSGEYDNVKKYSGEVVYPAGFDTIYYHIGYERVELDLLKVGRLPASRLKMGKAEKTVVEYDGQRQLVIDSICSWVNVTNLTESKLYRFKVYTEDNFGNQSVPQEIAVIPFTQHDRDILGLADPKLTVAPTALVADWPNGLNTVALDYHGLSYSYTDKDGTLVSASIPGTRFYCGNLEAKQKVVINVDYKVLPIVNDVRLLDTVIVNKAMELEMPTAQTPFAPTELVALRANGISTFTSEAVSPVTKIVLPMHITTLSDLFYFPNLQELDLTGKGLRNVTSELTLSGQGYTYVVGGGAWQPYMRRIEYTDVFKISPAVSAQQTLLDLLESGSLKKVTYIAKSMSLDDILAPYIESGVVELVDESWYPEEATIDPQLMHPGNVVTSAFRVTTSVTPLAEVPNPGDVTDPNQVYKITPVDRNATVAFTLPKEYMYDFERYRWLKFKVYMTAGEEVVMTNGTYRAYRWIWPRIRYSFWGPDQGNNPYGSGDDWEWKPSARDQYQVPSANINVRWTELAIDMKQVVDKLKAQDHATSYDPRKGHYHSRNICFNMGGEQGPNPYAPTTPIVYYFADVRLSKNQ